MIFASTVFTRAVDPVIPQIAAEFAIDLNTAALLSTAYTLPYALVQPVLGTVADFFGKTRLMNLAVLIVSIAALICALAPSFPVLVATRIGAGLIAGGVFPVAMALIGDLAPVHQRQVAIGRLLAIGLTGNLIGASIAGVIGDVLGWRGVFAVLGGFSLIVAVAAFFLLRRVAIAKPPVPFNLATAIAGFRGIFADPRAKVCFGAVFLEAIFIHGLFPYVAILLLAAGEARASIAGLVIAAFGLGGVVYSVGISVIIARVAERRLMIAGGCLAAAGLVLAAFHLPWYAQVGGFAVLGFGFYLLHGSIQVHVTELSQTARGAAASLHSCFFYLGQAAGPVVYSFGFAHAGPEPSLFAGAVVVVLIGLVCSQLLRHRSSH
ncbi:MAG: transporter, family, inner rane transport protein [Alphaproteobacteria bacterium]|nr:transporter, family, inner rane transport protein [Alphaproteobacteria bacterium]